MRKIELFTRDGHYVATVEIAPFQTGPDVVMWGTRTFVRSPLETTPDRLYEAFAVYSLTPSPGLDRQPRCSESTIDGAYRRPCELQEEHGGDHAFTLVTSANADQLRAK